MLQRFDKCYNYEWEQPYFLREVIIIHNLNFHYHYSVLSFPSLSEFTVHGAGVQTFPKAHGNYREMNNKFIKRKIIVIDILLFLRIFH